MRSTVYKCTRTKGGVHGVHGQCDVFGRLPAGTTPPAARPVEHVATAGLLELGTLWAVEWLVAHGLQHVLEWTTVNTVHTGGVHDAQHSVGQLYKKSSKRTCSMPTHAQ